MAARHGPVTIPTALGRFEGLVPQDGWHRYGTPRCRGRGLRTLARAHGLEGGLTTTRRRWARPSALRAPHGGGRPHAGAPRGHIPARAASGGRDGGVAEAFGPSLEAHRLPRGGLPGTQLGYDRGWAGGKLPPARLTGAGQSEQGARWGVGPGPPLAAPQWGLASSPPALGNQGPLIRRDRTAPLPAPWSMGRITHGALDKRDPTTPRGACIDHEHLGPIVTREAIRGGEQDPCKSGQGRPLPEAIETGAVEVGPAIAIVARDRRGGNVPIGGRRPLVVEATQLLCNRLLLWLPRRRDTGVQSAFHGSPPEDARAQDGGLRSVP